MVEQRPATGPPSVVIVVPAELRAVAGARAHLSKAAAGWGWTDLETLELVATELVTNAIEHAGSAPVVRLSCEGGGRLRLEVTDQRPEMPVAVVPYDEHTRGLGLHIVAAMTEAWGVSEPDGSKVVWAVLAADDG